MHGLRLSLLVLMASLAASCGAERAGADASPAADAGGLDATSTDARDAAVAEVGVADAGATGEDAATGVDASMREIIVEADTQLRPICDDVCAAMSATCNPDHSWLLGAFFGGGYAEYANSAEALDCDATPSATEPNANGVQEPLDRWRCACWVSD